MFTIVDFEILQYEAYITVIILTLGWQPKKLYLCLVLDIFLDPWNGFSFLSPQRMT